MEYATPSRVSGRPYAFRKSAAVGCRLGTEHFDESFGGIPPQRAEAVLVALSFKPGVPRALETKIATANGEGFAHPGTGVEREQQQGVVTSVHGGPAVRLSEQHPDLTGFQIVGRRWPHLLGRTVEDASALGDTGWVATQDVLGKGSHDGEALIAGRKSVSGDHTPNRLPFGALRAATSRLGSVRLGLFSSSQATSASPGITRNAALRRTAACRVRVTARM
jgi:hypothetical protein